MLFKQKLEKIVEKNNSLVCVGLDTDIDKIPHFLLKNKNPLFDFNKAIIDVTNDLVCAYKLNIAFYEASGAEGLDVLKKTIEYLKDKYPEIPIILDAKRGDIGNTNKAYKKLFFDYLDVCAVTLHPYLGRESLDQFLSTKDKFFFILCRTSNKGSGEFQDLEINGKKLYQKVAENVIKNWNINDNCGLVVGATYPKDLEVVRKISDDVVVLIPGIGKQGGDIRKILEAGLNSKKQGIIVNSSRGIIFASREKGFASKSRKVAEKLKEDINKFR